MWKPTLLSTDDSIYKRIAATLERDIEAGILKAGDQLPTLKELSTTLGVTPGTVNRAYELAHRMGLVEGEVGRGTFVLGNRSPAAKLNQLHHPAIEDDDPVDLSIVKANTHLQEPYIRNALIEIANSNELPGLLDYTPDGGLIQHRQAGATWMQNAGLLANPNQVILTAGAQHGLFLAIHALTGPNDLIFCEALCYPGVASIASSLGRRLQGIQVDPEGMRADALREACMKERPALVICIANCQNPTLGIMSAERRSNIAAITREFDLKLVDDDLYGFLAQSAIPPLASFAPERSLYLTSLSKSVLSTVRLGYIHSPVEWLAKLSASVRTSIWMVSPIAAQLATQLITSGKASELSIAQREEAHFRQKIATELLGHFEFKSHPYAFHIWLKLPKHWTSGEQFAAIARSHKIIVAPGNAFSMTTENEGERFIRVGLMGPTRERLRFILCKLVGLLEARNTQWV
jgi:DNA-binding transcriptional MocR family regulator